MKIIQHGPGAQSVNRQEMGDWQTPIELARSVLDLVARLAPIPSAVVEPTCGTGAFLRAANETFHRAVLMGYELSSEYVHAARAAVPAADVIQADFFRVNWEKALSSVPGRVLVVGNPPWVTNSTLGVLDSDNLPEKTNFKNLNGFEALTGKSNFDVSEWMIIRLLAALQTKPAMLAVLCKSTVARRVIEFVRLKDWAVQAGGVWRINAKQHFNAAVDAVLFVCRTGERPAVKATWPIYSTFDAALPESRMSVANGILIADADRYERTSHLIGQSSPEWRSGLKHDCSRVMELESTGGMLRNGLAEPVEIEPDLVFPLLKSSDVAKGLCTSRRAVVVPQRVLGEDTSALRHTHPKAWRYLDNHRQALRDRKSSIYRGQHDFAIFGIGPYSFAPWKVGISGLYKKLQFTLIGPQDGQPVMVDDTCYFLPFDDEESARAVCDALRSPLACDFLASRIFWDAKRPINKAVLQRLDLDALLGDHPTRRAHAGKPEQLAFI